MPNWLPSTEFKGEIRSDLAPLWPLVDKANKGEISGEEYEALYLNLLIKERKLDPQIIVDSLADGSILLCYEKPGETCHRRTLADWIELATGIAVPEWLNEKEQLALAEQNKKDQMVDSLLDF